MVCNANRRLVIHHPTPFFIQLGSGPNRSRENSEVDVELHTADAAKSDHAQNKKGEDGVGGIHR